MSKKLRYEIYIPRLYNNKLPIKQKKYNLVKEKLQKKFKGLSIHPATVKGTWICPQTKDIFFDNCFRYEIVVDKTPAIERWFKKFKEELKKNFNQNEIFMINTEINWI